MLEKELAGKTEPTIMPQLYSKAKTGKTKTWQIGVTKEDNGTAIIWTSHGSLDGKKQLKPKIIKIGKNIGKKNETTPYDQALNEAMSSHRAKIDKRYIDEIPTAENAPDIYLPMLALKYNVDWITLPCGTQTKINGVRCLSKRMSDTLINYTSRKFKSYNATLSHLSPYLLEMIELMKLFDGEIYRHGWSFQKILRHVKKFRPDSNQLQYWVYDVAEELMTNAERYEYYCNVIPDNHSHIVKVPMKIAHTLNELEEHHRENIGNGFEGTITRNLAGLYLYEFRSKDLLKKKDFIDEEFEIVGGEAEVVTEILEDESILEKRAIVFVCKLPNSDVTFKVRPRGTVEDRVGWLNEIESLKGEFLTVRFLEYSEDGIPTGNTVGIAIRNYE
jgi:DNA ligase-1